MIRREVVVSGLVQGVWFRDSCMREAHSRAVTGWVRNCADGRVHAAFEGPTAAVEAMVDWCRHGPPHARVTDVEVLEAAPRGESGFEIC